MSTQLEQVPSTRHGPGEWTPADRLAMLLDDGTFQPLHEADDSGVLAARGLIDGTAVFAYATDGTRKGGALGAIGCGHIVAAIEHAVSQQAPVVGLWHSGGAQIGDGVRSLDGLGRVFAAMTNASGRVPQVSVVLGPAAAGAAYGAALTDVVVMSSSGRIFVTGPGVVRAATGQDVDMETLGGAEPHRASGVVHLMVSSEHEAFASARRMVHLLAVPGEVRLPVRSHGPSPETYVPRRRRRAYDVRPVITCLLDGGAFEELQPRWAPNMVVGLGRLAGRAVGVVANNPIRKGGCLDSSSAEKAARFVRMCDAFGVALLVVADVPGYLPGVDEERGGIVRRGAKLLHAFAEATVPRVTVITRKAFGGAYIAMNSRALGATAVFAWPDAEIAVMDAEAAVDVLHGRTLARASAGEAESLRRRLVDEHRRDVHGLDNAVAWNVVDAVIEPGVTRAAVAEALAGSHGVRGRHGNIPL